MTSKIAFDAHLHVGRLLYVGQVGGQLPYAGVVRHELHANAAAP